MKRFNHTNPAVALVLSATISAVVGGLMNGAVAAPTEPPTAEVPPTLALAEGDSPLWSAGSVDTVNQREGKPSRLWAHGKVSRLSLKEVPADWSAYDRVNFWFYSPTATNAKFLLVLDSDNPETEARDYYSAPLTVDFTGWKQLQVKFADMKSTRKPVGWKQINGFLLTATGYGNTPDPNTTLSIGTVSLAREDQAGK